MARRFVGSLLGGAFRLIVTLLLAVVYVVVFVPAGLLLRLVGVDPLRRKWAPKGSSYWESVKVGR
jgi:hypothetical protein